MCMLMYLVKTGVSCLISKTALQFNPGIYCLLVIYNTGLTGTDEH